jgi:hypothetical protein
MKYSIVLTLTIIGLLFSSCQKYEEIGNENNPVVEDYILTNTLDDLILVSRGIEASMRIDLSFYIETVGAVGREFYDLNGADPRYTGELLGAQGGPLDPGGFLTTRSYSARYRAVKMCNVLIDGLETTTASLSAAERNGFIGYAETIKAYALLLNANTQYQNGIRVDVADPDNLGPFLTYDQSLAAIQALLASGADKLANGEMLYTPTSGFAGFQSADGVRQLNKAVSARVAIYQNDKPAALSALTESFFDLNGDLSTGIYHPYDENLTNPLYNAPNDEIMVVADFITDAEAGDSRLNKVIATTSVTVDGLTGDHRVNVYSDPLALDYTALIRNEELILIYAEANIGSNNLEAVTALNVVRNAAGVGPYLGLVDDASLETELLHQRRYSLFYEGHRWIDMRRYGRLDELSIDRPGDIIHIQFPRPLQETIGG